MAKFKKKPIVVEAYQWFTNGDHPRDYHLNGINADNSIEALITRRAIGWEGQVVRYFNRPDVDNESICKECYKPFHWHGWIDTLEGGHNVCPGDWIVTGIENEYYPVKPAIFLKTYELVEE